MGITNYFLINKVNEDDEGNSTKPLKARTTSWNDEISLVSGRACIGSKDLHHSHHSIIFVLKDMAMVEKLSRLRRKWEEDYNFAWLSSIVHDNRQVDNVLVSIKRYFYIVDWDDLKTNLNG